MCLQSMYRSLDEARNVFQRNYILHACTCINSIFFKLHKCTLQPSKFIFLCFWRFFLILQTQNYRNLRVQMMKYTIDKHFCLHLHVYDFGICTLKFGSSREIIMCAENSYRCSTLWSLHADMIKMQRYFPRNNKKYVNKKVLMHLSITWNYF